MIHTPIVTLPDLILAVIAVPFALLAGLLIGMAIDRLKRDRSN